MDKIQEKVIQFLHGKTEATVINDVFKGSDLTDQQAMLMLEELKFNGLINIDSAVFSLGNVSNNIQRTLANTSIKAVLTDEGKKIKFSAKDEKVEPEKKAEPKVEKESIVEKVTKSINKAIKPAEKSPIKKK